MGTWARCKSCNASVGKINLIDGVCFDGCKIEAWKKQMRVDINLKKREKSMSAFARAAAEANRKRFVEARGWPKPITKNDAYILRSGLKYEDMEDL